MRVRFYHTLPAEGRTSSEVYASELSTALGALAGSPVALSHCRPQSRARRLGDRLAPLRRVSGYVDRYLSYQWQVRGQDADVNHVVDHGYGHLVFSLDPRRTVVTFHDAILLRIRAGEMATETYPWFTILGHRLSLVAIERVSRIIADSESSRRDLVRFTGYSPDRVRVIPLGVSERFFRDADVHGGDGAGERSRPPRVLHVGHCGLYKNIETILRMISVLSRRLGERVFFTKVGEPFTPGQLVLIAGLGLQEQVEHLGRVSPAGLPGVYARADLLLMPSLHEGFGMPVLEAMASGTPVVASDRGALPEVVGDAGVLVPSDDVEAVATAVEQVLTDAALRAELRSRGLERARAYTWERTARATLEVYEEVDQEAS